MNDGMFRIPRIFSIALAAIALAPALFAAPPVYDEILTYGDGRLAHATLPNGPASPAVQVTYGIRNILALPSGQLLATTQSSPSPPSRTVLNELLPDGSLRRIGEVPAPPGVFDYDEPVDLALDHRGRLYLLTYAYRLEFYNQGIPRLAELDPATAAVRAWIPLHDVGSIATAPDGLWAVTGAGIAKLDPDSGDLGKTSISLDDFGMVSEIEADSSGRLWFIFQFVCSPPCIMLGTVDPEVGLVEQAPVVLHGQTPLMYTLTIRRRCIESATVRCLQGGRFRAQVDFRDYAGVTGKAEVAPARSGDSGLFYFFDPANWELMVKVLDGCTRNANYWVFASASTDVGYDLKITDTETDTHKVYSNSLGAAAYALTDIGSFPCTPEAPRNSP